MINFRKILASTLLIITTVSFAKVNINEANLEELAALKGIGVVKAEAIVQYREDNGSFKSIDELTEVKGIGDATLSKVRDDLILEGKTDLSDLTN